MNDDSRAKPPPHAPMTAESALQIARQKVAELSGADGELLLEESKTQEHEFGWVFFWTTKKYLETGDPQFLVPGNGPLVVNREDGSTHLLSTSVPPARAIAEYEDRWRRTKRQK